MLTRIPCCGRCLEDKAWSSLFEFSEAAEDAPRFFVEQPSGVACVPPDTLARAEVILEFPFGEAGERSETDEGR